MHTLMFFLIGMAGGFGVTAITGVSRLTPETSAITTALLLAGAVIIGYLNRRG